jgi:hypothetical protein
MYVRLEVLLYQIAFQKTLVLAYLLAAAAEPIFPSLAFRQRLCPTYCLARPTEYLMDEALILCSHHLL